jgi:hypothetical protein
MDAERRSLIPDRIGIRLSLVLFGVPALALWLATGLVVPALVGRGWEPLSAWFLAAGMLVLAPLLAAAIAGGWMAVPATSFPAILKHLRVRRLSAHDWRVAGLGLAVTLAAMAALQLFNARVWPQLPPHPPFMTVQALDPARYYLLALWLPFLRSQHCRRGALVARVHSAPSGAGVRCRHMGHPGPSSRRLSFQFRLGRHVHPLAGPVHHSLGRTAHAKHICRHAHSCWHQWARILGRHSRPSAHLTAHGSPRSPGLWHKCADRQGPHRANRRSQPD